MFTVLLTAFSVLLARYSGQEDITVATPMACRQRGEFEGLVGYCANLVCLRANLSGNPSFAEMVKRVGDKVVGQFGFL